MAFLPQTHHKLNLEQCSKEEKASFIEKAEVEASQTTKDILAIILDYTLNKFDDAADRIANGIPKFLSVIEKAVKAEKELKMCLPAFPFKSSNKVYKVFSVLPDKAEELALERLNTMCSRIGEIYPPGAQLTIVSDGLIYNDLLCIPDRDTWAYGEALRLMAIEKGFTHINFNRLRDLVNIGLGEDVKLGEITYVANATNFRREVLNQYGNDDLDVNHEIATNPDTKMTYCGYRRFLESDLQHAFPTSKATLSGQAYRKNVSYLAKEMLRRGHAFAGAVKEAYPDYLRLSIHHSTGEHKISICLLNTTTGYTTPWHCSVARTADGQWTSAPMGDFADDPNMTIVHENGRPSYFQEQEEESVSAETAEITESSATSQIRQIIKEASNMTLQPTKPITASAQVAVDSYAQNQPSLVSVGAAC